MPICVCFFFSQLRLFFFFFICLSVFLVWICLGFFLLLFSYFGIFFSWMDGNKLSEGHQTLVVAALLVRPAFHTLRVAIVVVWISLRKNKRISRIARCLLWDTHTMNGVGSFSTALPILRKKKSAAQPEIFPLLRRYFRNKWIHVNFSFTAAAYAWYTPKNFVYLVVVGLRLGSSNSFLFR